MQTDYESFIQSKTSLSGNFGFEPTFFPDAAFDFQRSLIDWSVRKGRAAIFADCGMGKTLMELSFAENVVRRENKPVLLLTPLAVGAQTVKEAAKFGIDAVRSLDGRHDAKARVVVANYERLHLFNPGEFAGTVCDESSILKNFDGVTRKAITEFMSGHKYRLLATATAAPNDFVELGTSSEALGYLRRVEMMSMFFNHDGGETSKWRLKKHAARSAFWQWLCSWARAIRKPSDIGFSDELFVLPELVVRENIIESPVPDGELFAVTAIGLNEQRKERRKTLSARCEKAAEIAMSHKTPSVTWCSLNSESDMLESLIKGCVNVSGNDSDEEKEEKFNAFQEGQALHMITKPAIAGFGLNWQHCCRQVYFPSHSFEQYYQGVRRSWRFGQKNTVTIDIVASDAERSIIANLKRKSDAADKMFGELAKLMGRELHIEKKTFQKVQITKPSFL